jgi:hypothetical protein
MKRGIKAGGYWAGRAKLALAGFLLAGLALAALIPESAFVQPALAHAVEDRTCFLAEEDYATPFSVSAQTWRWLQANMKAFDTVAAFDTELAKVGSGRTQHGEFILRVSRNFFRAIGIHFVERATGGIGSNAVVYLGEAFCKREYGTLTNVVGKHLRLNDEEHIIAGIVAAHRGFPQGCDIWAILPEDYAPMGSGDVRVVARLKENVNWQAAQRKLAESLKERGVAANARLVPLTSYPLPDETEGEEADPRQLAFGK